MSETTHGGCAAMGAAAAAAAASAGVKSFYFILESFFSILDPGVWEGIPGFLWGEMADDRSVAESETSTGVASIAATVDVDAASSVIADSSTATEVAPLPALPSPELQTPPGAEGGTADATGSESSRVLDPTGSTMDLDAIPRVSVKSHDGTEMDLKTSAPNLAGGELHRPRPPPLAGASGTRRSSTISTPSRRSTEATTR